MTKVYLKENSWLAKLAARKLQSDRMAIVWRSTVHLHNTSSAEFLADQNWVNHELKHIAQFKQYGWFRFACLYLLESIKHGYYNNRFEKEARLSEHSAAIDYSIVIRQKNGGSYINK